MLNHAQRQVLDLLGTAAVESNTDPGLLSIFREFARSQPEACERHLAVGHFTGSAWLVSADGERVLLTHHRKLYRWLQSGGHADGDSDLARVALREAEEESGLTGLRVDPVVFDIDRHAIPARGAEPEHWHYDVRFVVRAGADEAYAVSDESHALAWQPIEALAADASADLSLRRMAGRWLDRQRRAEQMRLVADRIILQAAPSEWLKALGESDAAFAALSGLKVSPNLFPEADRPAFAFFATQAESGQVPPRWGSYVILTSDGSEAIGSAGYKGAPRDGAVEIGYSVAPAWQGRGIAREAAARLAAAAFEDARVERVLAHTLAQENASVRLLRALDFRFVGDVLDPDDGPLWKWELRPGR